LYLYNPEAGKPGVTNGTPLISSKFIAEVYGPDYYSLQIYRRENNRSLLFSTSRGPTIASENYWELSLQFPKDAALFGLGGLRLSSKPKLLYNTGESLGANPLIIILDAEGRTYGILFANPGPMEFQLLENSNLLLVKSLSTVMWDISVFAGPTPADVMQQYTSSDGRRPTLPPPWALGFHVCRNTSKDNETLAAGDALYFMKEATEFPYESDCLQERLLYQFDFHMSETMGHVAEEFRKTGRKLLLSLPPQVSNGAEFSDRLPNCQPGLVAVQTGPGSYPLYNSMIIKLITLNICNSGANIITEEHVMPVRLMFTNYLF
jgi:alpha-glucosidase (family GH31 glycosyl hydrolase)